MDGARRLAVDRVGGEHVGDQTVGQQRAEGDVGVLDGDRAALEGLARRGIDDQAAVGADERRREREPPRGGQRPGDEPAGRQRDGQPAGRGVGDGPRVGVGDGLVVAQERAVQVEGHEPPERM